MVFEVGGNPTSGEAYCVRGVVEGWIKRSEVESKPPGMDSSGDMKYTVWPLPSKSLFVKIALVQDIFVI